VFPLKLALRAGITEGEQKMEEMRQQNVFRRLRQSCLSMILTAFAVSFGFNAVAFAEIPESPEPVLISTSDSTRALASYAQKWRGGLPGKNTEIFMPGERAVIFVTNIDLMADEGANAFRVYAEDANGKQYRLTVEDIQQIGKQSWIYGLTVRIYDENEYNGQPSADGDVLIRVTWRGNTSNRVRLGLGATGGKIKDDENAVPTPAPLAPPAQPDIAETGADRIRFMEQAAFGPTPALETRLRQTGMRRWIEEQFNKQPTFPYPDQPLRPNDANAPATTPNSCNSTANPAICQRDSYTQYLNQNWMFKEALYGDDQLRRRVSWALHQIWVVSGVDTQQQRWMQEYYEVLDRNAFGNYRNLMKEMTLNPAMGNYLDMVRSTRTNPNENYPREILQLFGVGLDMLNQDGTPILDNQGNRIPTYDQEKVNQFTKVFTGWTFCNNGANPACPNFSTGTANYIDPMLLVSANHDLTAKTLFSYTQVNGQSAPFSTIPACVNCTTDATRVPYANASLDQTLDNIFYHPSVAPFVGKLLIQHLVTSDPSPAYVARVSAAFNNNGQGVRGDMKAVIRAILLDPEARGSRKNDPNYGKLREPFQLTTNLLRHFNVKSADGTQQSDGYIAPNVAALGQNIWNPPTVFNYFPPDYIVPGTDVAGPEFAITNTGSSFGRINFLNTMIFSRINCTGGVPNCQATGVAPLGTSISLAEPQAWAAADATGNTLIEGLNAKMLHGRMSVSMKNTLRTAITAVPMTNTLLRAQQAVYLVTTSSQYQVQR
jgi:uncharacterized protein (DUF1800 family)